MMATAGFDHTEDVLTAGPDDPTVDAAPRSFEFTEGGEVLYQPDDPESQQPIERPTASSAPGPGPCPR